MEALPRRQVRAAVHLAARLPPSFDSPEARQVAETNEKMDANVFHACRRLGLPLVFASGASVYGQSSDSPLTEQSAPAPFGPYPEAKLRSEQAGQDLLCSIGVPFASLRISAPYGPGQKARTVLNIFMERALQGLPLTYHGTGSREQDFTWAGDVGEAICQALLKRRSGIFNISSGRPVTMKELAELVVRTVPECRSEVIHSGQADPQEGFKARISIEKASRELGWNPAVSLEEGIARCIRSRMSSENELQ